MLPKVPATALNTVRLEPAQKRKRKAPEKPKQTIKVHKPQKSNRQATPVDQQQTTLIPPPEQVQNAYQEAVNRLNLSDEQGKIEDIRGLLYPTGPALNHPAAEIRLEFRKMDAP